MDPEPDKDPALQINADTDPGYTLKAKKSLKVHIKF
jgi:hypothetical protein